MNDAEAVEARAVPRRFDVPADALRGLLLRVPDGLSLPLDRLAPAHRRALRVAASAPTPPASPLAMPPQDLAPLSLRALVRRAWMRA